MLAACAENPNSCTITLRQKADLLFGKRLRAGDRMPSVAGVRLHAVRELITNLPVEWFYSTWPSGAPKCRQPFRQDRGLFWRNGAVSGKE